MMLEERMQQLKHLITQEKKTKDKLYIKNCRLLNAIESSEKQIKILGDKSQKDNILINEVKSDIHDLYLHLRNIDRDDKKTDERVEKETAMVADLQTTVMRDRREL